MRNVLAIARRELSAFLVTPMAYVIMAGFLVVLGLFFALNVLYFSRQATLRPLFQTMYALFLFVGPALTMRLLAEEQRTGTLELLLTAPVREVEVVLGKFLGGFGALVVLIVLSSFYPLLLSFFGPPDRGPLLTGYLGALLFGAAAIALGLVASSLTQNQIVAWVVAFAIFLVLWAVDGLAGSVGGAVGNVLNYLALFPHFDGLSKGVLDSRDVIYFLSLTAAGLFTTTLFLEARRWR